MPDVAVHLSDHELAALRALADRLGISIDQAVAMAIAREAEARFGSERGAGRVVAFQALNRP